MKNIVLIGFMGTGKTSTGRLLASRLGRPFTDTDQKIEMENNLTITEMFALYGEDYFREKEAAVIVEVSRLAGTVIATGGGVVLRQEDLACLKKSGIIIALTASLEVILERTSRRHSRPLLNQPDRAATLAKMLQERSGLYDRADLTLDTSEHSPQQISEKIIVFLRQGGHLRG